MLSKKYSIRVFRPSQVDIVEEEDDIDKAKAIALDYCKQGFYTIISETLYEYNPN